MEPKDILLHSVGILGILASILSFQCRKHNWILTFRTANELLFALQYLLLGLTGHADAYTGMAMNLVGCVRNTVFTEQVKRGKSTRITAICFSILFLVFTAVTWAGAKSILIGFAKVVSTLAYGNPNPRVVRLLILLTGSCWLFYNIAVGAWEGVACEALTLISIVTGIVRYDILKKN